MMKIRILAFGIAKDILNARKVQVDLPADSSVADLRSYLSERYPSFVKLASLRFALDNEYVDDAHFLRENAEVVIIPPVSGG